MNSSKEGLNTTEEKATLNFDSDEMSSSCVSSPSKPVTNSGISGRTCGESVANDSCSEETDTGSDVVVSLEEVVAEEEALEADAQAVLGASDDSKCTYPKGYVYRQALYACATCCPEKLAGMCLACSLHCHDGHELFELYTKRHFRCDCGNSHFPKGNLCRLYQEKDATNEKNHYNHNFHGLYCTCNRPYPDSDDKVPDEQIQCVICEDWFHSRHLVGDIEKVPKSDDYSEMICRSCVEKLPFLLDYCMDSHVPICEKLTNGDETNDKGKTVACSRPANLVQETRSLFLSDQWRKGLCKCDSCLAMYRTVHCEFLLSDTDPVHYYESQATKKNGEGGSLLNAGMKVLEKMDRTNQIEMLHGNAYCVSGTCGVQSRMSEYNALKSNLTDYLKQFAEKRKVVTEDDIKNFFDLLKSKKRPRLVLPEKCS